MSPECCVNSDCGAGEYCNVGVCTAGCSDDTACPGCSTCLNHQCTQPECCSNSDCTDPSKPVCSPGNVCTGGSTGTCYKDSDCQVSQQVIIWHRAFLYPTSSLSTFSTSRHVVMWGFLRLTSSPPLAL